MALIAALVLLGWLSSTALIWWDTGKVNDLQNEITELQANHDALVKAGMLGKLTYCGERARPCIAVNENAGQFGPPGGPYDLRVIKGY